MGEPGDAGPARHLPSAHHGIIDRHSPAPGLTDNAEVHEALSVVTARRHGRLEQTLHCPAASRGRGGHSEAAEAPWAGRRRVLVREGAVSEAGPSELDRGGGRWNGSWGVRASVRLAVWPTAPGGAGRSSVVTGGRPCARGSAGRPVGG